MDARRRFLNENKSVGSSGSYTVVLNSQWRKSTTISNPDSSKYDGVYESYSNYNVNSGVSIMYIDIVGYSSFKLHIRSYAESNYDYVMVSQLDKTITGNSSYSDTSLIKAHTRGNQQSGTSIGYYTLVEFTGIDLGSHRITVLYRKDGSVNNNDDKGYLLIEGAGSSGDEGDVEIDTTYSITYTSTDGNIVTPYSTNVFGAKIVSNTYIDGSGIITFDGYVTEIGVVAFAFCSSLKNITIPNSVTEIGYGAFKDCSSLTSVTIGDSVTTIGDCAFQKCSSLTNITIPDSVTEIKVRAFSDCSSLTNITIPDSVTEIETYAFSGCSSLTSVTIGDSVTKIGSSAFSNCSSLTNITIPDSVTEIGYEAFSNCSSLTTITIPDSVTEIGWSAFYGCSNLTSIYCKPTVPPTGGDSMFVYISTSAKIYVPVGSGAAYKAANYWRDYASMIVEYNFS